MTKRASDSLSLLAERTLSDILVGRRWSKTRLQPFSQLRSTFASPTPPTIFMQNVLSHLLKRKVQIRKVMTLRHVPAEEKGANSSKSIDRTRGSGFAHGRSQQ